ncbi:unnamed protein product [Heligmosomoides polygyrus]|uniref:Uncharacterized protein n=1 Tax=Heligmosomoides polygyrus TaxID=6339 RepID=A0A183G4B9_HELPZ|nr:unnamed protein product [Heligmosomoides polygyrus]
MSDYDPSDSESDYSDGPVQIPIDFYHPHGDWEIEMRWYLAALMAAMTPPPTPSDSEHTSSESEGVYSDEED